MDTREQWDRRFAVTAGENGVVRVEGAMLERKLWCAWSRWRKGVCAGIGSNVEQIGASQKSPPRDQMPDTCYRR